MMSNKHRLCGIFYTGCKLPDADVQVREQSCVNDTWRHDNTGIEKAVLSWCLLMDLSKLNLDLIQVDLVKLDLWSRSNKGQAIRITEGVGHKIFEHMDERAYTGCLQAFHSFHR